MENSAIMSMGPVTMIVLRAGREACAAQVNRLNVWTMTLTKLLRTTKLGSGLYVLISLPGHVLALHPP